MRIESWNKVEGRSRGAAPDGWTDIFELVGRTTTANQTFHAVQALLQMLLLPRESMREKIASEKAYFEELGVGTLPLL